MANLVAIDPKMIRWAVDRSRLALTDFPTMVGDWIDNKKTPTFNQLESFAKKAMVPFGYLFLDKPPVEKLPMPDYRTMRDSGVKSPSPNLLETVQDMQRRQAWMREYLVEEGHTALPYVGSESLDSSIANTVGSIRRWLKLESDWATAQKTWEDAVRLLVQHIESAGILVFINGVVGNSTNRSLDPDEFRGFVLCDTICPLIFVNGADAKAAQMFTLVHELAHIWIGEDAIVNLPMLQPGTQDIEKFCNRVAAEFLVPEQKLRSLWPSAEDKIHPFPWLANRFKASPVVVARRAKDLRLITADTFFEFYNAYMDKVKRQNKEKRSGANFYLTQNARLGRRFGRAVIAAAESGRMTYQQAYDLTRLYGSTYDKYVAFLNKQDGQ